MFPTFSGPLYLLLTRVTTRFPVARRVPDHRGYHTDDGEGREHLMVMGVQGGDIGVTGGTCCRRLWMVEFRSRARTRQTDLREGIYDRTE